MQLSHVTAFWLRLAGNILLDLFSYVHMFCSLVARTRLYDADKCGDRRDVHQALIVGGVSYPAPAPAIEPAPPSEGRANSGVNRVRCSHLPGSGRSIFGCPMPVPPNTPTDTEPRETPRTAQSPLFCADTLPHSYAAQTPAPG